MTTGRRWVINGVLWVRSGWDKLMVQVVGEVNVFVCNFPLLGNHVALCGTRTRGDKYFTRHEGFSEKFNL